MKDEKRAELANQLQQGIDEYWLDVTLDDIITLRLRATTGPYVQREAEEFRAIRMPKRDIPGLENTIRVIPLNEDRVTFRHIALDRITHINGKTFQTKSSWLVKGSKGYYTVKLVGGRYTCTCQGFMYRKKCKHSQEIKDANA